MPIIDGAISALRLAIIAIIWSPPSGSSVSASSSPGSPAPGSVGRLPSDVASSVNSGR